MRVSPHRGIAIVQLFPALHVRPCRGLVDDCWQVQSRKKNLDCPSKTTLKVYLSFGKGKESWVEQACLVFLPMRIQGSMQESRFTNIGKLKPLFLLFASPKIHARIRDCEYNKTGRTGLPFLCCLRILEAMPQSGINIWENWSKAGRADLPFFLHANPRIHAGLRAGTIDKEAFHPSAKPKPI